MRAIILVVAAIAIGVAAAPTPAPQPSWVAAAHGVIERLLPPPFAANFSFSALARDHRPPPLRAYPLPGLSDDTYVVSARGGVVSVSGTSGVALTAGAYWYLTNVAGCLVTWGVNGTGDQLSLPKSLPDTPGTGPTTVTSTVPVRYAWNMCTFSYSAVWWDAARWQREIDWMALHGVNFPLALTGQEYVWVKVFARYNVSLSQLQSWLTGPAFLAWQRAGNIRGFAGPLTWSWIDGQRQLQLGILAQMRALGMTPILTCFAGHVPKVALTLWPNATITPSEAWNGFPPDQTDVYYVDPTDPLFVVLGKAFMEEQLAAFGEDHYYSCDTFNEVNPKSAAPAYLAAASAAVHQSIASTDPAGIWVMQAWLFHNNFWNPTRVQAYLSGVGNSQMLILDLNSEAGVLAPLYNQYYGKPWVWNMLHNYGGVRGVYGNLTAIATMPYESLATPNNTMLGIGFTPEAIEQNPVMYEMLTSTFWSPRPIAVMPWLQRYVANRYGGSVSPAWQAWQALFAAVYNQPGEPRSEIEWVPHWESPSFGWQNGDATGMLAAFRAFLAAAPSVPHAATNGPFQYDLVDVTRQAATMFFSDVHRQFSNEGWRTYDGTKAPLVTANLRRIGGLMLDIINALDELLGTNPNYLLGTWTSTALQWAAGANETALYLFNAKNQITMWGPAAQIDDYAAKAWNGLYGDYYARRWSLMINTLINDTVTGTSWNSFAYQSSCLALEQAWCSNASATYPDVPPTATPALTVAQQILELITANDTVRGMYMALDNTDLPGFDVIYTPTWTRDIGQLMLLCSLMDDCAGFNTNGYLKTSAAGPFITSPGTRLYVKQSATPAPTAAAPGKGPRGGDAGVSNQNSHLFGGGGGTGGKR